MSTPMKNESQMTTADETARRAALVSFLDVLPPDVRATKPGANTFFIHDREYYGQTWLVLTNEEADALTHEAVLRDVWTCNTFFLRAHVAPAFAATFEAFEPLRERLNERANLVLLTMIANPNVFVANAVASDGRGHFLSPVDRAEHHAKGLYLYRQS